MSTVPLNLVSFDYIREGSFVYEFSRHFGEEDCNRPATCLCIHAILLAKRGSEAMNTIVGFSFQLCGCTQDDWILDEALRFMRMQGLSPHIT